MFRVSFSVSQECAVGASTVVGGANSGQRANSSTRSRCTRPRLGMQQRAPTEGARVLQTCIGRVAPKRAEGEGGDHIQQQQF